MLGGPHACTHAALAYAYQHADRHNPNRQTSSEEWKFSKARQNWLTRHIWYEDAVPVKYVDLVVHYLKSVQGGARDVCSFFFMHDIY